MNDKTIKMIQRCAVIQDRPIGALRSEWSRATPSQRGKLRGRWQEHARQLVAVGRKVKGVVYLDEKGVPT